MRKLVLLALLGASLCCGCVLSQAESGTKKADAILVSETSDANFKKDVLLADKPVLVDFYATWCGPCSEMSPIVDKVADQYKDKLKVFKVDVDKNPELAEDLQIESIPLLTLFKNGKLVSTSVGLIRETEVDALVDKVVSH